VDPPAADVGLNAETGKRFSTGPPSGSPRVPPATLDTSNPLMSRAQEIVCEGAREPQ